MIVPLFTMRERRLKGALGPTSYPDHNDSTLLGEHDDVPGQVRTANQVQNQVDPDSVGRKSHSLFPTLPGDHRKFEPKFDRAIQLLLGA